MTRPPGFWGGRCPCVLLDPSFYQRFQGVDGGHEAADTGDDGLLFGEVG